MVAISATMFIPSLIPVGLSPFQAAAMMTPVTQTPRSRVALCGSLCFPYPFPRKDRLGRMLSLASACRTRGAQTKSPSAVEIVAAATPSVRSIPRLNGEFRTMTL